MNVISEGPVRLSSAVMAATQPSATDAVSGRARAMRLSGRDVIDLSIGAPHVPPPPEFLEAAAKALRDGPHGYTDVAGIRHLREAIAERLSGDTGVSFDPDEVIVGNGAKGVIFNALAATLDPGDEVVFAAPYWVSYPDMVRLAGGVPRPVPGRHENRFILEPDALRGVLGSRTRWVVLNSPANPTGAVMSPAEIGAVVRCLEDWPNVLVLSDEIYAAILYDGRRHSGPLHVAPHLKARTLVVDGLSKAFAAPGWRIGFGAGPRDLIRLMATYQSQSTSNAGSIAQTAAIPLLRRSLNEAGAACRAVYEPLRDRLRSAVAGLPDVGVLPMEGAFYAFLDIRAHIGDRRRTGRDIALAESLLEAEGVALMPGSAFGGPGYLRLSYAAPQASLLAAVDRMARFLGDAKHGR